jgi:hypothetical protein
MFRVALLRWRGTAKEHSRRATIHLLLIGSKLAGGSRLLQRRLILVNTRQVYVVFLHYRNRYFVYFPVLSWLDRSVPHLRILVGSRPVQDQRTVERACRVGELNVALGVLHLFGGSLCLLRVQRLAG